MWKANIPVALFVRRNYPELSKLDLPVLRGITDPLKRVEALKRKDAFSDNEFLLPMEACDKERAITELLIVANISTLEGLSKFTSRPVEVVSGWTRGRLGMDDPDEPLPTYPCKREKNLSKRTRVPVKKIIESNLVTPEEKEEFKRELQSAEEFDRRVQKEVRERLHAIRPDIDFNENVVQFRITLPTALYTRLMAEAERREKSPDEIIDYALSRYLPRPTTINDIVPKEVR
jgi:hypothetical protein